MLRFYQGHQLLDSEICFMQLGLSVQLCLIGMWVQPYVDYSYPVSLYLPYPQPMQPGTVPVARRSRRLSGSPEQHGLLAIGFHGHTAVHGIWFHGPPDLLAFGFREQVSVLGILRNEHVPTLFENLHQQSNWLAFGHSSSAGCSEQWSMLMVGHPFQHLLELWNRLPDAKLVQEVTVTHYMFTWTLRWLSFHWRPWSSFVSMRPGGCECPWLWFGSYMHKDDPELDELCWNSFHWTPFGRAWPFQKSPQEKC